tara:strand:- start:700 stop:951 length:252 start_codon:yes stop_codon:yes gene_type:complete
MKDSIIYEMARATAKHWWAGMDDAEQQKMADRYYPNDDFLVTHEDEIRIEKIWSDEFKAGLKTKENNQINIRSLKPKGSRRLF